MAADFFINLIQTFGYLGVFVSMIMVNASVFLPLPGFVIIVAASAFLNPLLVGVAAAAGGALGELTSYAIGYGGGKALEKKLRKNRWYSTIERLFKSHKGSIAIFAFTALPLAVDVVGIVCGVLKYNKKKFLLLVFLGKLVLYTAIAYASYYGLEFLINYV
ncbi:MAG: VTT domain-containing protein [Candidatus Aenigmarchaeota archaeon]|nr:VTT domain-containing protein [Candidatus Aenigmarchaeota archaeon]